jgi:hypothetical protein
VQAHYPAAGETPIVTLYSVAEHNGKVYTEDELFPEAGTGFIELPPIVCVTASRPAMIDTLAVYWSEEGDTTENLLYEVSQTTNGMIDNTWNVSGYFPNGFTGHIWAVATDVDGMEHYSETLNVVYSPSGYSDIRIGTPREIVHKIMGEPDGMLSGLFGDIYKLEDGSRIVFYYDSESAVQSIRRLDAPEAVKWEYIPTRSAVFPALPIWFDIDADEIRITANAGTLYLRDGTQRPSYVNCGREKTYKQDETVLWGPMEEGASDSAGVATDCSLSFEIRQGGNVATSGIIHIAQIDKSTDGFSSEYIVTLAVADVNLILVQGQYVDGGCVVTERH